MVEPYSREFYAPRPSRSTVFFRTFFPWQLVRFAWINLKMIRMIGKAHHGRMAPAPSVPAREAQLRAGPGARG